MNNPEHIDNTKKTMHLYQNQGSNKGYLDGKVNQNYAYIAKKNKFGKIVEDIIQPLSFTEMQNKSSNKEIKNTLLNATINGNQKLLKLKI